MPDVAKIVVANRYRDDLKQHDLKRRKAPPTKRAAAAGGSVTSLSDTTICYIPIIISDSDELNDLRN